MNLSYLFLFYINFNEDPSTLNKISVLLRSFTNFLELLFNSLDFYKVSCGFDHFVDILRSFLKYCKVSYNCTEFHDLYQEELHEISQNVTKLT